jgi:hypothetical protein
MAVSSADTADSEDSTQARPPATTGALGARLVGFRLSDGARAWETPLPEGLDAVSGYQGVLLGYSRQGTTPTVVLE